MMADSSDSHQQQQQQQDDAAATAAARKAAAAAPPSLRDEIGEALAQSMLVFLLADLRLLSGTGRCRTRYERIAIDSDAAPRNTAARLAGLTVTTATSSGDDDGAVAVRDKDDTTMEHHGGVSPAHLMAVLLLELRHSVDQKRRSEGDGVVQVSDQQQQQHHDDDDDDAQQNKDAAEALEEDQGHRRPGRRSRRNRSSDEEVPFGAKMKGGGGGNGHPEGRHALLRSYAEMIGSDLNAQVAHIEARRSLLSFAAAGSSSAAELQIDEEEEEKMEDVDDSEKGDSGRQQQWRVLNDPVGLAQSRLQKLPQKVQDANPITQSKLQKAAKTAARASVFRRDSEKVHEQLGEVADAVFEMGEQRSDVRRSLRLAASGGEPLMKPGESSVITQETMLRIMERAVESRESGRLQFMEHFFKKDSVCQLMVRSQARIVWMNDWYPLKDLTYAVAVDVEKKRVLVVFRGAITRADWSHAADWNQVDVANPVKEDYPGRHATIGLSRGFLLYLFRRRQDTGTEKVDEILNVAHKYGTEKIGAGSYSLVVAGHSLGAALGTLFGFYASTDERFTRNGPVKIFTFGSPYVAGHTFADTFRHQEQCRKLQYARVYNDNDTVAHLPTNFGVTRRGSTFRHVGIGIKVPGLPRRNCLCRCFCCKRKWKPSIFYTGDEGFARSYARGIGRNFLLHMPLPWLIPKMHTLEELQKRLIYGSMLEDTGGTFDLLKKPIGELYEMFVGDETETKD